MNFLSTKKGARTQAKVVWNERNQRIFDNKAGEDPSHLWNKVKF